MFKVISHKTPWLVLGLLIAGLVFAPTVSFGQEVSKEEAKKWKNLAKKYKKDPMLLKVEIETYQQTIADFKAKNKELERKIEDLSGRMNDDEVAQLKMRNIQLEEQMKKMQAQVASQNKVLNQNIPMGLIYRVQLIALALQEIDVPQSQSTDFLVERSTDVGGDGMNKFLVGAFRTKQDADSFRDEMIGLGFKDAWIVPYIDGVRATIHEANEYIERQGAQASFLDDY